MQKSPALRISKYLLVLYVCIVVFPLYLEPSGPGLDQVWVYTLNYLAAQGIKFGHQIAWTYGPLGYLVNPMAIQANLYQGIAFQLSLWLIFAGFFAYLARSGVFTAARLLPFVVFLVIGSETFYSIDYFICFFILICLAASIERDSMSLAALAALLSVLLMFVKFSTAAMALPAVFLSAVLSKDGIRWSFKKGALFIFGIPLLFAAVYLLYNPSITDLFFYFKNAFEISSGYSSAMSVPGKTVEDLMALLVAFSYLALIIWLYKGGQKTSFWLSILFLIPLFFSFKHGFVRQDDGHVLSFFSFSSLLFGVLLLFADARASMIKKSVFIVPVLVSWYIVHVFHMPHEIAFKKLSGLTGISRAARVLQKPGVIEAQESLFTGDPPDSPVNRAILDTVGREKVSFFTTTIPVTLVSAVNYAPFPVMQNYSAYTPYLDKLNSDWIEDGATAPRFIVMSNQSIDKRHPFMDVPSMWTSIYKWYDVRLLFDNAVLLERRKAPRTAKLRFLSSIRAFAGQKVEVPDSENRVIVRIELKRSLYGRLMNVLYKTPKVNMEIETRSGAGWFRVVQENLLAGFIINYLPTRVSEVAELMERGALPEKIERIRLTGDGLGYYHAEVSFEFFELI